MIARIMLFFKHILSNIFRVICWILRCGRRKKSAEVSEENIAMTDVVIGDVEDNNYPKYGMNSTLMNGYEVPAPNYYDKTHQSRHPYQSQSMAAPQQYQESETEIQMQSWDQWDYEETQKNNENTNPTQNQNISYNVDKHEPEPEKETDNIDFFADMEPSVKVKKIFVKKKQKTNERSNRLAIDQDLDFRTSSELDAWQDEDEGGVGWADEDVEIDHIDADQIAKEARELRKQERIKKSEEQKKQKLAKKSKHQHDHRLGMKVS